MLRMGISGLGTAGLAFIPAIEGHPGTELCAVAEPNTELRKSIVEKYGIEGYADLASMLERAPIDAVCVATPTDLHSMQVCQAFASGKHVIVEKPMAVDLPQSRKMVAAADAAGKVLLVGHSHSYDLPIRRMREVIREGRLGRVRMIHNWTFSDWMYRPRMPDELDTKLGGGVTFRQGSHQFDIIRLLGGGAVRSVRAQVFDLDTERRGVGAHAAFLTFVDGTIGTAVYNGYGGLPTEELSGVSEWGFHPDAVQPRRPPGNTNEAAEKRRRAGASSRSNPPFQPHFGLTIVNCEKGDVRQSPSGLFVYGREGRVELPLENGISPHALVVEEFHDAIVRNLPAVHDGRWALANLEVCLAALRSSETGRAVPLLHQIQMTE